MKNKIGLKEILSQPHSAIRLESIERSFKNADKIEAKVINNLQDNGCQVLVKEYMDFARLNSPADVLKELNNLDADKPKVLMVIMGSDLGQMSMTPPGVINFKVNNLLLELFGQTATEKFGMVLSEVNSDFLNISMYARCITLDDRRLAMVMLEESDSLAKDKVLDRISNLQEKAKESNETSNSLKNNKY